MLGPHREETEVSLGSGDLQWGLRSVDASSGNTCFIAGLALRAPSHKPAWGSSLFCLLCPSRVIHPVSNCEVTPGASFLER